MNKQQILYPSNAEGRIHPLFMEEATMMASFGFCVDTHILPDVSRIIYRGFAFNDKNDYPTDERMVNYWEAYQKTLRLSKYYTIISPHSIPTFFVRTLDEIDIIKKLGQQGWNKAFIREDRKSLFWLSENASVWPNTTISQMTQAFHDVNLDGPYAIRAYIDNPDIFYEEKRFWILNGNPYHPSNEIPDFVIFKARELYLFSGSKYFTMDVAGEYIVEVNPGECSDRGGDTPLEFFCDIFSKEFICK